MKSVIFDLDRTVRLTERPEPRPTTPTSVLLAPTFVGICGTDLHAESLDHFRPGVVMGHEFTARVIDTGSLVKRFRPGDIVVVNPNGNTCGECDQCRRGTPSLCHSAVFQHGIGIHEDGGMAPQVVVDERTLFAVPPAVSEPAAAWTEPLATAVRAVKWARATTDTEAAIIGAGPIGLLALQVLRNTTTARLDVIEPSPYRRKTALQFGADHATSPDLPLQSQPDVIFECSGSPHGFAAAVRSVRPGGTVVVVGLAIEPLQLEPFTLVGRELTLQGSIIYDDTDFADALQHLADSTVNVDALTTDIVPLDNYAEAFARLQDPEAATKILLQP